MHAGCGGLHVRLGAAFLLGKGWVMTEKDKRDQGLWYDANYDNELLDERLEAEGTIFELNHLHPREAARKRELLEGLLGSMGKDVEILMPFNVDYGYNVHVGDGTFINHRAYLMDCAPITIGSHVFIGPSCGMYTAQHPLTVAERNAGLERALPITVEDDVWLGANVTILPGVTIGCGSVIGAGSVVARDIPAGVVAVGSPCRVAREITEADVPHNDR